MPQGFMPLDTTDDQQQCGFIPLNLRVPPAPNIPYPGVLDDFETVGLEALLRDEHFRAKCVLQCSPQIHVRLPKTILLRQGFMLSDKE